MCKDSVPEVYSNIVDVYFDVYGAQLSFRCRTAYGRRFDISTVARVHLSLQQALVLNAMLTRHLELYQEEYGELRMPDEISEKLQNLEPIRIP